MRVRESRERERGQRRDLCTVGHVIINVGETLMTMLMVMMMSMMWLRLWHWVMFMMTPGSFWTESVSGTRPEHGPVPVPVPVPGPVPGPLSLSLPMPAPCFTASACAFVFGFGFSFGFSTCR